MDYETFRLLRKTLNRQAPHPARRALTRHKPNGRPIVVLLLTGLVLVGPWPMPATAVEPPLVYPPYYDDFEDDAVGAVPTSTTFYKVSSTTGSVQVTNDQALGTKSVKLQGGTGGTTASLAFDMGATGYTDPQICSWPPHDPANPSGHTFYLAFRLSALPPNTAKHSISLSDRTTGAAVQVTIDNAGNVNATSTATGGSGGTVPAFAAEPHVWYNLTIGGVSCVQLRGRVSISGGGSGGATTFTSTTGDANKLDKVTVSLSSQAGYARSLWVDDLAFVGPTVPPPTVAALSSVAVTDLVGWDVSRDGNAMIERSDGGANIRARNPFDLTQVGPTTPTGCAGRYEMVRAVSQYVVWISCDESQAPQTIHIRTPTLTDPAYPDCGNADVCPQDFAIEEALCDDFDPNNFKELRDFDLAAWDYSPFFDAQSLSANSHGIIWAYTTSSGGHYGVNQYTAVDNACDYRVEERREVGANVDVDQICAWTTPEGRHLLAVADETILPRVHEYVYGTDATRSRIDGALTLPVTYGAAGGAKGVACAGKAFAFLRATSVLVYNLTSSGGTPTATKPVVGGSQTKGIAVSGNARFVAYTDGAYVVVAHAGNLTSIARAQIPAGVFRAVYLSQAANMLWIATSSNVQNFQLSTYTAQFGGCDVADCDLSVPLPVGGPANPGDVLVPVGQGAVGSILPGFGLGWVGLVAVLVLTVGAGVLAYKARARGGLVMAAGFAGLCFGTAAFRPDLTWIPVALTVVSIVGASVAAIGNRG